MFKNMKFKSKMLMSILLPSALIIGTITVYLISSAYNQIKELSQIYATQLTEKYAKYLEVEFGRYFEITEAIAIQGEYLIGENKTSREDYNAYLKKVLEENPDLLATWVCFEENGFDGNDNSYKNLLGSDNTGRYIPYFYRKGSSIYLEPLVDYEVSVASEDYLHTKLAKVI